MAADKWVKVTIFMGCESGSGKVNTDLSILKGKTGSYQAKRNVITGYFTSRGNSHIANSIFEKRIPLKREDIPNLPNYLANAPDEGASEADNEWLHNKKGIAHFRYASFQYGHTRLYFNLAGYARMINGRRMTIWEVYDITKDIKQRKK